MAYQPLLSDSQPWQHFEQRRHQGEGVVLAGHHNRNVVVTVREPLASMVGVEAGGPAMFRQPLRTARVVPRLWPHEPTLVTALCRHLENVPRCLQVFGRNALYTFTAGVPLSQVSPRSQAVGETVLRRIAENFGRIASVPLTNLPSVPKRWPANGDSTAFLRWLVDFAERRVRLPNRSLFDRLFDDLAIPRDAALRFHTEAKALHSRPFALLHTDLHRDNILVTPGGELFLLDWETALYGDPLHDLATHLIRMDYPDRERERMTELWPAELAAQGRADMTEGLKSDLRIYMDFEYVQSIYADTLRAAMALRRRRSATALDEAVTSVRRALRRARGPLCLSSVASPEAVRDALDRWMRLQ